MSGRSRRQLPRRLKSNTSLYRRDVLLCGNCHNQIGRNDILILESCSHAICEDCVKDATESDRTFVCPLCQGQATVPRSVLGSRAQVCGEIEEERLADESSHFIPGVQMPDVRGIARSPILAIANPSSDQDYSESYQRPYCVFHPGKARDLYCLDCEQSVCKICARTDHHALSHRLRDVKQAVKHVRLCIAQIEYYIHSQLLQTMHTSIRQEQIYRHNLQKKWTTLKTLVDHQAECVIDLVRSLQAKTLMDLKQQADQADIAMKKRIDRMNQQIETLQEQSDFLSEAVTWSEEQTFAAYKSIKEFFGKDRERHFGTFFQHNRSAVDFNVMATLVTEPGSQAPKELTEAVRRHIGTAIKGPSAIVYDSKRSQEYPLAQKSVHRQRNTSFPRRDLKKIREIMMEWKKMA